MKIILLCLLFAAGSVSAQTKTGNQLLSEIRQGNGGNLTTKVGVSNYMLGVEDGFELERLLESMQFATDPKKTSFSRAYMCYPDNVTNQQTFDVIEQYLVKNPATRNLTAPYLIRDALIETWPCAGNPPIVRSTK